MDLPAEEEEKGGEADKGADRKACRPWCRVMVLGSIGDVSCSSKGKKETNEG